MLSGLWLRLYIHALLRESRIFPDVELCDESPNYTPAGFADIWKGYYHGELVCVKAIRTQYPICLMEIEKVHDPFILSEAYSVHFAPDIPSCRRGEQAKPTSEHTPSHRGFGDVVPLLHHDSMDAGRQHHTVHSDEPQCQSADAGTWQPTRGLMRTTR